jgi:hypothetical protein
MVYHNFDNAVDDPHNYYPSEFLNTLTPNGLPPHVLKLKIGSPIILLRNIDPAGGLCNGMRLVVRGFQRNTIDVKIMVGLCYAPQMTRCFCSSSGGSSFLLDSVLSWQLTRHKDRLSPMLVCICLNRCSLMVSYMLRYLEPLPDRTLGSLLSHPVIRRTRKKKTKINVAYTKNIVYKEILTS